MPVPLKICYYNEEPNFGDSANLDLCAYLSKQEVELTKDPGSWLVMGSILSWPDKPMKVWGSGIHNPKDKLQCIPEKVWMTRGPRSRNWLKAQGVSAPPAYADPGVLFSDLYPAKPKKYSVGIVPHYADLPHIGPVPSDWIVIDVRKKPKHVAGLISSCERLVSSALHGVIAGDSYGIPTLAVRFGSRVVGGSFKFYDYFEGCGQTKRKLRDLRSLPWSLKNFTDFKVWSIDRARKTALQTCPFRS